MSIVELEAAVVDAAAEEEVVVLAVVGMIAMADFHQKRPSEFVVQQLAAALEASAADHSVIAGQWEELQELRASQDLLEKRADTFKYLQKIYKYDPALRKMLICG